MGQKETSTGRRRAHHPSPSHCSPSHFPTFAKTGSCLTDGEVRRVAAALGIEAAPGGGDTSALIHRRLGTRPGEEHTWVALTGLTDLLGAFRPEHPAEWLRQPRFWLSNFDIRDVMQQYEDHMRDSHGFRFIGVFPRDFASRPGGARGAGGPADAHTCVSQQMCALTVPDLVREGVRQFGIIFNLDKHTQSGSHWTACYCGLDPRAPNRYGIWYYDSVGNSTPREMMTFMKRIQREATKLHGVAQPFALDTNRVRKQFKGTECGVYAMFFIITCVQTRLPFLQICRRVMQPDDVMFGMRSVFFRPPSPRPAAGSDGPLLPAGGGRKNEAGGVQNAGSMFWPLFALLLIAFVICLFGILSTLNVVRAQKAVDAAERAYEWSTEQLRRHVLSKPYWVLALMLLAFCTAYTAVVMALPRWALHLFHASGPKRWLMESMDAAARSKLDRLVEQVRESFLYWPLALMNAVARLLLAVLFTVARLVLNPNTGRTVAACVFVPMASAIAAWQLLGAIGYGWIPRLIPAGWLDADAGGAEKACIVWVTVGLITGICGAFYLVGCIVPGLAAWAVGDPLPTGYMLGIAAACALACVFAALHVDGNTFASPKSSYKPMPAAVRGAMASAMRDLLSQSRAQFISQFGREGDGGGGGRGQLDRWWSARTAALVDAAVSTPGGNLQGGRGVLLAVLFEHQSDNVSEARDYAAYQTLIADYVAIVQNDVSASSADTAAANAELRAIATDESTPPAASSALTDLVRDIADMADAADDELDDGGGDQQQRRRRKRGRKAEVGTQDVHVNALIVSTAAVAALHILLPLINRREYATLRLRNWRPVFV